MSLKKIAVACMTAALFAGCAADGGESSNPAVETTLAPATQAATPCTVVTATLTEHNRQGRASKTVTTFFIWQVTAFYAARNGTSQLPAEYLGADGNQSVTLYSVGLREWTAVQARCVPPPICGDGVRNESVAGQPFEQCDGADLAGDTCADFHFPGGTLGCKSDCTWDFSRCQSQCGNGTIEGLEQCDGANAPLKTCAEVDPAQYTTGTVKCASNCTYDVSGCTKARCGDGIVTTYPGNESCDGTNLNSWTCAKLGNFSSGTLKCKSDCTLDTSGCQLACGDGHVDPEHEECDGTLLNPAYPSFRCADYNFTHPTWPWNTTVKYASGTIKCDSRCKLDILQCKPPPGCYTACGTPGVCVLECH